MKKIDIHKLEGYQDIDISFEKLDSTFHAKFLGQKFIRNDIRELKTALTDAAAARKTIAWKPVILIKTGHWEWQRSSAGLDMEKMFLGTLTEPDKEPRLVLTEVHTEMYKDDLDTANWKPAANYSNWSGDSKEQRLVDYTRERWEALIQVEVTLHNIKKRLTEIMHSDLAGGFLDRLAENKLLLLTCAEETHTKKESLAMGEVTESQPEQAQVKI